MTREEAIEQLQNCKGLILQDGKDWFDVRDLEVLDMAIEALTVAVSREDTVTLNSPISIQAEMVSVVRCKDCRHIGLFSCPLADNEFQKDDDYCSWGERKEE